MKPWRGTKQKLGFEVCMDNDAVVPGMRWLTVCPVGNAATQFVLMLAREEADKSRVGTNLMTVLGSTDCIGQIWRDWLEKVSISSGRRKRYPGGSRESFSDLYGNPYNLVGPG